MCLLATATFGQGIDAIAQSRQRLIDLFGFLQRITGGASFANLLGAGQVGQIEFALFGASIAHLLMQSQNEQTMTSTAGGIHVGACNGTVVHCGMHDASVSRQRAATLAQQDQRQQRQQQAAYRFFSPARIRSNTSSSHETNCSVKPSIQTPLLGVSRTLRFLLVTSSKSLMTSL
jgi:transcription initiation factor TFIID subunit TAF12